MTYSPQPPVLPIPLEGRRRLRRWYRHASRASLAISAVFIVLCGVMRAAEAASTFTLASPTVRSEARMPDPDVGARGGCKGHNQSPPLAWTHAPPGTASYAISMADLDAKLGVVWLWLMFNIPASVTSLAQNAASDATLRPPGAGQARNGFDVVGYLGPCPKKGNVTHHYLITVWALNQAQLPFKDGAPSATVAIYLRGHALGHASLTARYGGH